MGHPVEKVILFTFVQKLISYSSFSRPAFCGPTQKTMYKGTVYLMTEIPSEYKKTFLGEAAKECHFTFKQT